VLLICLILSKKYNVIEIPNIPLMYHARFLSYPYNKTLKPGAINEDSEKKN